MRSKWLLCAASALLIAASASAKNPPQRKWEAAGGGSLHQSSADVKLPDRMRLVYETKMGCPVPGKAQLTVGGGLVFSSSP